MFSSLCISDHSSYGHLNRFVALTSGGFVLKKFWTSSTRILFEVLMYVNFLNRNSYLCSSVWIFSASCIWLTVVFSGKYFMVIPKIRNSPEPERCFFIHFWVPKFRNRNFIKNAKIRNDFLRNMDFLLFGTGIVS